MIKTILWDVDNTLLNFDKSEEISINEVLNLYNITLTKDQFEYYKRINHEYWKKLELKQIEKDVLLKRRFEDLFKYIGVNGIDGEEVDKKYQLALGNNYFLEDDALYVLEKLQDYDNYFVTNGTKVAQENKLKNADLYKYVKNTFISEDVGDEKPSINFFNKVKKITHYNEETTIIIGDSLTSDIKGGINAHIKTIWYNPKHIVNNSDIIPDYEIDNLVEILNIIK